MSTVCARLISIIDGMPLSAFSPGALVDMAGAQCSAPHTASYDVIGMGSSSLQSSYIGVPKLGMCVPAFISSVICWTFWRIVVLSSGSNPSMRAPSVNSFMCSSNLSLLYASVSPASARSAGDLRCPSQYVRLLTTS